MVVTKRTRVRVLIRLRDDGGPGMGEEHSRRALVSGSFRRSLRSLAPVPPRRARWRALAARGEGASRAEGAPAFTHLDQDEGEYAFDPTAEELPADDPAAADDPLMPSAREGSCGGWACCPPRPRPAAPPSRRMRRRRRPGGGARPRLRPPRAADPENPHRRVGEAVCGGPGRDPVAADAPAGGRDRRGRGAEAPGGAARSERRRSPQLLSPPGDARAALMLADRLDRPTVFMKRLFGYS
eukprot:292424-Prorocentrum_minimum.AAC.2